MHHAFSILSNVFHDFHSSIQNASILRSQPRASNQGELVMKICGPWHFSGEFTGTQESGIAIDFERNGGDPDKLAAAVGWGPRTWFGTSTFAMTWILQQGWRCLSLNGRLAEHPIPRWAWWPQSASTHSRRSWHSLGQCAKCQSARGSVLLLLLPSQRPGVISDFWLRDGCLLMLVELCWNVLISKCEQIILLYFICGHLSIWSKLGACTIFVVGNQHLQNIAEPHEIVQECVFAFFCMLFAGWAKQVSSCPGEPLSRCLFFIFLCNSMHACAHIWSYMCT